jgi:hypothetical protein
VLQKRRASNSVAQAVAQRTSAVASRGFAEVVPRRGVGRGLPPAGLQRSCRAEVWGGAAGELHSRARGCRLPFSTPPQVAGGEEGAASTIGTASSRLSRHPLISPSAEERTMGETEEHRRIRPPRPCLALLGWRRPVGDGG